MQRERRKESPLRSHILGVKLNAGPSLKQDRSSPRGKWHRKWASPPISRPLSPGSRADPAPPRPKPPHTPGKTQPVGRTPDHQDRLPGTGDRNSKSIRGIGIRPGGRSVSRFMEVYGWGGRIRTYDTRYQKPMPYRLATPQLCRASYARYGAGSRPFRQKNRALAPIPAGPRAPEDHHPLLRPVRRRRCAQALAPLRHEPDAPAQARQRDPMAEIPAQRAA